MSSQFTTMAEAAKELDTALEKLATVREYLKVRPLVNHPIEWLDKATDILESLRAQEFG